MHGLHSRLAIRLQQPQRRSESLAPLALVVSWRRPHHGPTARTICELVTIEQGDQLFILEENKASWSRACRLRGGDRGDAARGNAAHAL